MKRDTECEDCTALVLSLTISDVVGATNYIQPLIVAGLQFVPLKDLYYPIIL